MGMLLVWSQALMLPLDVANNHLTPNSGGIDMKTFWSVVYISTLVMITILLPFAMLFYETDEDHTYCKRFLTALCYLTIALALVCILLFVSWVFLKYADIPMTSVVVEYSANGDSTSEANLPIPVDVHIGLAQTGTSSTMTVETSFVVYCMAIMSFVGWLLLICFGGVGLFALPVDWINDFRKRPKARKSEEMLRTKEALLTTVEDLKKECEEIKEQEENMGKN
jgi:LMBR1 domain-containing protein 1